MGLNTLFGPRSQGWFIPYRYADTVSEPIGYPALENVFAAARPGMESFLGTIDGFADALRAIGPDTPPQPRWNQSWFPRLDGASAYAMVRTRHPSRIVEIGSGHSTRFMARAVADGYLNTEITAIDPAPRAAINGLGVTHIAATLHDTDVAVFETLAPGDIMFIDSSHVLMPGTDVDYLLNTVWPSLPSGVVVHIHDILLPDGYPVAWSWRGYNEQSGVAPLLSSGDAKLLFGSHYAATRLAESMEATVIGQLTLIDGTLETSLWIEKS